MSYIFQTGLQGLSTGLTYNTIRNSTGWVYASDQKSVGGSTTGSVSREVSAGVGSQPANGVYVTNKSFRLPNSYSNADFQFKVGKYDDINITNQASDTTTISTGEVGSWKVASLGDNNTNTALFNQNTTSHNKEVESDWLLANFDLSSLPSDAIIRSIQLKITRKSISLNDKDMMVFGTSDDDIIPNTDDFLLNNNITTYTRDHKISFVDDYDNTDVSIDEHDNMVGNYVPESISVETFSTGYTYLGRTLNIDNISSDLNSFTPPKGTWDGFNKESVIYGDDSSSLWGYDSTGATSVLRSGNFGVKMKVKQKVFRGYGFDGFYNPKLLTDKYSTRLTLNNSTKNLNWDTFGTTSYLRMMEDTYPYRTVGSNSTLLQHYAYRNSVNYYDISLPLSSYVLSRVYSVAVNVHYEQRVSGFETTLDDRSYGRFTSEIVKTNDIYFKNQKCFDGVCFKYSTSLDDIYNNSILTTNRFGINNMYSEYNIIDKYIPNSYEIDYAVTEDTNTGITYHMIDGSVMKPGNTILLTGQVDKAQNDLYTIDGNYSLVLSDILSDMTKSNRCKFTVKYGTSKEGQYFLSPLPDDTFPVTGMIKEFTTGHSYIIKNLINYNIDNTSTFDVSKVLFTDYSVARTLGSYTGDKFTPVRIGIDMVGYNDITVKYRDLEFTVTDSYDDNVYCTGITNTSDDVICGASGDTIVRVTSPVYNRTSIGDYVEFKMYETHTVNLSNTRLTYYTTVKSKYTTGTKYMIELGDTIPWYNIQYMTSLPSWTYSIDNLNKVKQGSTYVSSFMNSFKKMPLGDLVTVNLLTTSGTVNTIEFVPKLNDYKYFDYGDLTIEHSYNSAIPTVYTFGTTDQYADYELKPFFDRIVYDSLGAGVTFPLGVHNNTSLSPSEFTYTNIDGYMTVVVNSSSVYKVDDFMVNTFIDISPSYKSLILSVSGDTIVLGSPSLDGVPVSLTSPTLTNISDFSVISDILLSVYRNYTSAWYTKLNDSYRNRICSTYARVISRDSMVRSLASGIIYQDGDLWNYDIFNLDINSSGFTNEFDRNMTYVPVEVLDVGKDRITKLQKNIDISNITIPVAEHFTFMTGFTTNYNSSVPNNSYLYDGVSYSSGTCYLGSWDDRIRGANFSSYFTYYDSDNRAGTHSMLVTVGSGFTEEKLFRIYIIPTGSPLGSNKLVPVSITSTGDNVQCLLYINSSTLGAYSFDLFVDRVTNIYTEGVNTSIGNPLYILLDIDVVNEVVNYTLSWESLTSYQPLSGNTGIVGSVNTLSSFNGGSIVGSNTIPNRTFYNFCVDSGGTVYTTGKNTTTGKVFIAQLNGLNIVSQADTAYNYGKIGGLSCDAGGLYLCLSVGNKTYIMKYDYSLNLVWTFPIGKGTNIANCMVQDDDNLYVAGYYSSNIDLGTTIFIDSPVGKTYSYIIKVSKLYGVVAGARNIVSTTSIIATSLVWRGDDIEVSGYYTGTVYMDGVINTSTTTNYFITKINKSDI